MNRPSMLHKSLYTCHSANSHAIPGFVRHLEFPAPRSLHLAQPNSQAIT